ncbi:MAG: hypothetical protein ACOC0N_12145 [Chroococcales cyanobacterium]
MRLIFHKFALIKTVLLVFPPLALLNVPMANAQTESSQVAVQNQYAQKEANAYLSSCQESAVDAGLGQQQAQTLCQCTLNKLQSRYSAEEFRQLRQRVNQGERPKVFTEVGMTCFVELSSL